MLDRSSGKTLIPEIDKSVIEKNDYKKQLLLELLTNRLLYFWNVYIWPNFSDRTNRSDVHFAMKHLVKIQVGEKILEVGSSIPAYIEYSKNVKEQGLFVALDLHLQVQKKAKKILQEQAEELNDSPFLEKLLTANGGKMPFANDIFDVVIANNYNGDSMAMLEETLRVLRPGGRLGFSFSNKFEALKCYKICLHLGLELTKIQSLVTESGSAMGTWVFVGEKNN
jgi:ubiquinone/menaquinone biosynthesis C-methylase UbiE